MGWGGGGPWVGREQGSSPAQIRVQRQGCHNELEGRREVGESWAKWGCHSRLPVGIISEVHATPMEGTEATGSAWPSRQALRL